MYYVPIVDKFLRSSRITKKLKKKDSITYRGDVQIPNTTLFVHTVVSARCEESTQKSHTYNQA
jgi:hypothetical protein